MRKKIGRGKAYEKALIKNLVRNLSQHKQITTTVSKAKLLKQEFLKTEKGLIKMTNVASRAGDNAPQVQVEWITNLGKHENKANNTKGNTKSMASS